MILQKKKKLTSTTPRKLNVARLSVAAAASSLNHVSATSKALALVMGDSQ